MEYIHDLYDALKNERVDTNTSNIKIKIGETILEAEMLLIEYQKRKNDLKNRIDGCIVSVQQYEKEILAIEEDMKWANEAIHVLKEWVDDGR